LEVVSKRPFVAGEEFQRCDASRLGGIQKLLFLRASELTATQRSGGMHCVLSKICNGALS
jgi:hypothetical protein